ncbi:TRAP transporter substrate-binding protein [Paenalcaligenes suwonensis]|uniref:TRAP transporter substrate-binding protein n=1 Tax=Paenalcaligenes suwonensis TaxID=1202713 RepID=UPI00140E3012|nr:TRAP transporter substrate-binding protein [Paenalcaligenes suwonensis]NHC62514.1 TRAP transporter substrate-binding protein [Paenalcaligenes suwonensis]
MKLLQKLGLCMGLGLSTMGLASNVQAETQVLRFSNWLPPAHYIVKEMLEPWAEKVSEVTEGRVKIEFINPLGKPQAHLDLVRNGIADMGMSVHSYTASRFPMIEFAEMPFTTDNGEINSVAYWNTYSQFMMGADEHRGVKLMGLWTSPATVIFTTKPEVNNISDLSGLKLRSPSPLFDAIGKAMGIVTLNAPASESYEMLSRGVIDGLYFQYDQIENFKLDKLIKSAVAVPGGFGKSSQFMFMNERKWQSLNEADRAAIEQISGEYIARDFGGKWQASEDAAIKTLTDAGLKTYTVEGEQLAQLRNDLAFIETDWIAAADKKGIDGKAVLEFYRAQIETLSNQ